MDIYEQNNQIGTLSYLHSKYHNNTPYPLLVIDNLWNKEMIESINLEFESFKNWCGEKQFYGAINKRFCNQIDLMPTRTSEFVKYLNSSIFIHD